MSRKATGNMFFRATKQTKAYCVYGLFCPLELKLKYIGFTNSYEGRIYSHYTDTSSSWIKTIWTRQLIKSGVIPVPLIIRQFDNIDEAKDFEYKIISENIETLLNGKSTKTRYNKKYKPKI